MNVRNLNLSLWTTTASLAAIGLASTAYLTLAPVEITLDQPAPPHKPTPATSQASPDAQLPLETFTPLWAINFRKPLTDSPNTTQDTTTTDASGAPFTLVGTIGDSLAMVRTATGIIEIKSVGEQANGAKIIAIRPWQVDIEISGVRTTISKPREPGRRLTMPTGPFILFADNEIWRIASPSATDEVRFDREATVKQIASELASKLRTRGYQGHGLILALPASWCLAALISTTDLPRQERAAMAFRLEEKLPLPAENFTADFAPFANQALGVCVPNEKARPLVEALEHTGVVVLSVTPAVMLAAQELTRHKPSKTQSPQLLIWAEGDQANLISLENGAPRAWALTQNTPAALTMQFDLALMELAGEIEIIACELPQSAAESLRNSGHEISPATATLDAAVSRIAPEILSGATSPWFELRRGAMAVEDSLRAVRRSLNSALTAAAIICIVLAGAFIYRAARYNNLAETYERSLAEEFKKEFPNVPLPLNPQATLLSEQKKLMQTGSTALPPEAQESALRVLRDVLAKIPPEAKLTMEKMTFNDTSIELSGKSRAPEEVDLLVAAARAAGMEVPQPQTRKDASGNWTFLVRGSKSIKAPLAGGRE